MNQPYYPPPGQGSPVLGNLDDVDEGSFTPFPAADYWLRAVSIESPRATAKGDGQTIPVEFEVMDQGPHQGRKVYENFNIVNPNAQTVQIALRGLKQWIIAAGHDSRGQLTFERVKQLEGLPVRAKVKIEVDRTGEYDDKNRVARFLAPAPQTGAAAVPAPGVTPAPGAIPSAAPTYEPDPTQPPTVTHPPGPAAGPPPAHAHPAPAPGTPPPAASPPPMGPPGTVPAPAPGAPPVTTHAPPPGAPAAAPAAPPVAAPGGVPAGTPAPAGKPWEQGQ